MTIINMIDTHLLKILRLINLIIIYIILIVWQNSTNFFYNDVGNWEILIVLLTNVPNQTNNDLVIITKKGN